MLIRLIAEVVAYLPVVVQEWLRVFIAIYLLFLDLETCKGHSFYILSKHRAILDEYTA